MSIRFRRSRGILIDTAFVAVCTPSETRTSKQIVSQLIQATVVASTNLIPKQIRRLVSHQCQWSDKPFLLFRLPVIRWGGTITDACGYVDRSMQSYPVRQRSGLRAGQYDEREAKRIHCSHINFYHDASLGVPGVLKGFSNIRRIRSSSSNCFWNSGRF
jgi:hypothetical protein